MGELAAFEEAWAKFVADRNEQYDATAAAGRAGGPKKKLALKAGGGGRK
jgi:hypothetical protein